MFRSRFKRSADKKIKNINLSVNLKDNEVPCNSKQDDNLLIENMTMEELLEFQEKVGTKGFTQKIIRDSSKEIYTLNDMNSISFKRENKNRPQEVPMLRRPAPRYKKVHTKEVNPNILVNRDPRFDDLSGKLDITAWKKNYTFLKIQRSKEKNILKRQIKLSKNPEIINNLRATISRMENQERESSKIGKEMDLKRNLRNEAISALKSGKAPKFVSKKEKQLTLKSDYYDTLKRENRLDKYLTRKDKKLRIKELKKL